MSPSEIDRRRRGLPAVTLPLVLLLALACLPDDVRSEPWAAPGDPRLRHDLQLLFDVGVLRGPSLSWPISWPDVARDLAAANRDGTDAGGAARAALERVRARLAREQAAGGVRYEVGLVGGSDPSELRGFADAPREEFEAAGSATWLGERFAWKLSATVVADPEDGDELRPDGSYVAARLGNWMVSLGYLDRWWGPGWDGSLILSTNARSLPTFAVERAEARASELPVFRWLGPWRFMTSMGYLEGEREDFDNPLLFGMRFEMRPLPSLQIAASRTAMWCGDGRPCDMDTFGDLLLGQDNDQDLEDQPGNQLAGFDLRWTWPGGAVPLAAYAQAIGEDEAGSMPSKYLGLFGLETWGVVAGGSWRAHLEYADTACDFLNSPPEFGCAYASSIYTDGYRDRQRALGHTMDGDGEGLTLGLYWVGSGGEEWRAALRDLELNRAGLLAPHSLASDETTLVDLELTHRRGLAGGTLSVAIGYADVDALGSTRIDDGARGYLGWSRTWP